MKDNSDKKSIDELFDRVIFLLGMSKIRIYEMQGQRNSRKRFKLIIDFPMSKKQAEGLKSEIVRRFNNYVE